MPDQGAARRARFFVLGLGTTDEASSYATLQEALAAVETAGGQAASAWAPERPVEIMCQQAGTAAQTGRRARHRFFVDMKRPANLGEGTELLPWLGLATAGARLRELHEHGELALAPGERIRLIHREVFAATSLERRKRVMEQFARIAFGMVVAAMIVPVLSIIGYLFYRAAPVLSLSFIFQNPHSYMTAGGVWAPLVGTFYLAILSLLIDAPIGILAAIYLNEYATDNWLTRTINLAVINLAGVPSIVHGLFGFGAFVLFAGMGKSVLAASCTLAVMSLPVIITATREALASVPMSFREACWNMGATKWQTIRTIVLPNSLSGILTGVIFEICRTAGETAPIMFTGAVFYYAGLADSGLGYFFPYHLSDTCMALQYHLYALATQVRGVSDELQYGAAAVLIGLTLTINSLSITLRVYLRAHKKW